MEVMKIIEVFFFTFFSYLFVVFPASASGGEIKTCPSIPVFDQLCNLNANTITTAIPNFLSILLVLAVILAIIFLVWGGVKWIMAGGDKAAIESARAMIIGAIVGLILAFAAFFIFNLLLFFFGVQGRFFLPAIISP